MAGADLTSRTCRFKHCATLGRRSAALLHTAAGACSSWDTLSLLSTDAPLHALLLRRRSHADHVQKLDASVDDLIVLAAFSSGASVSHLI